jgi:hypothetical protein
MLLPTATVNKAIARSQIYRCLDQYATEHDPKSTAAAAFHFFRPGGGLHIVAEHVGSLEAGLHLCVSTAIPTIQHHSSDSTDLPSTRIIARCTRLLPWSP